MTSLASTSTRGLLALAWMGLLACGADTQSVALDNGSPNEIGSPGNDPASPDQADGALEREAQADDPLNPSAQSSIARWSAQPLVAPPSYLGTKDNGAQCNTLYATLGFEPIDAAGARHPLFLYFVGTIFAADDQSARYDSLAARTVTEAMARRGFVALSVQYDNGWLAWLSDHKNQLTCLFAPAQARSVLAAACALPQVDCAAGIATWGHSQGGLVASSAANHDPRVRAAWTTGYGGDAPATLAKNRLRVVNGEADGSNATVEVLNTTAGFSAAECPDDGRKQCLRADGSGWIIVQKLDCAVSSGDHCWFDRRSCRDSAVVLEPNWTDRASTKAFALERNADWLAATALQL